MTKRSKASKADVKTMYDRFADAYHSKRQDPAQGFWNAEIDQPAMRSLTKPFVKGRRVLDLGCGSGIFTRQLAQWGASAEGLDLSKTMIEIARRENPGLKFHIAAATNTRLPSRHFDLLTSCLMLHYFADLKQLFRECARLLKPQGRFIFSFHHPVNEVMRPETFRKHGKSASIALRPYFSETRYQWQMLRGMKLVSYHHTFETIFKNLAKAEFCVEALLEPRPAPKAAAINPKAFDLASTYPSFVAIRARKP